ncbi:MAG: hypothetical protein HOV80_20970 [Polyangiaceae bacterium]|nr:hypothetical protein [Polyangiaceae bacterium]
MDVLGVSDDGKTIVGKVLLGTEWQPCVWFGSQSQVLEIPDGAEGQAEAVSDDGQRVVGWAGSSVNTRVSIHWDRSGTAFGTFEFLGESQLVRALACDDSGDVVVGEAGSGAPVVCHIGPSLSCVEMVGSGAGLGLSGDGKIWVGNISGTAAAWRTSDAVMIWTSTQLMGGATAITDDGSVLVGALAVGGFYGVVADDGVDFPLTGGIPQAVAGSAASWVAVGNCPTEACKWDNSGAPLVIQEVVAADYQGATLVTAADITADGTIIVGVANGPFSEGRRPYRLKLGP